MPQGLRGALATAMVTLLLALAPMLRAQAQGAAPPASAPSVPASEADTAARAGEKEPPRAAPAGAKVFPSLDVEPNGVLDFGQQPLGAATPARVVQLTAATDAETVSLELRASGAFSVAPARCELAAGGSCALEIHFEPTQVGAAQGAVVAVDSISRTSRVLARLTGSGTQRCDAAALFSCHGTASNMAPVGLMVLIYTIGLLAVRWNRIALPTRRLLQAEIVAVQARVQMLQLLQAVPPAQLKPVEQLLQEAGRLAPVSGAWPLQMDLVFWSRGHESAA